MRTVPLGRTGLEVTELMLGSMTWGTQNTRAEAHAQIDMALDHGINCIDTAEMYPVNPVRKETIGGSEAIIGEWFAVSGRRDDVILATKHSGEGQPFVRDGAPISSKSIAETVEESLKRLRTDYIDLYQFHWPNRGSFMFRKNWDFDPSGQRGDDLRAEVEDSLGALQILVDQGKIRHFGLSNDSAWGTAQWLRFSEDKNLPRVQSIQNEYSLLCRLYDTDMAEMSANEDVTLLAFSPLATGLLTGKYSPDVTPEGSRRSLEPRLGGRLATGRVWGAIDAYAKIAKDHGLSLPQMALAWCRSRPFAVSAIFGATTMDQLATALGAADVSLSQDVLNDISQAHKQHPMPY